MYSVTIPYGEVNISNVLRNGREELRISLHDTCTTPEAG